MTDKFFAGFYVLHETYYSRYRPSKTPEIMLGYYAEEGGTAGEFAIRWHSLGGRPVPRLEVYGDGVKSPAKMIEEFNLLDSLNLDDDPRPDAVVATLRRFGLRDITERQDPDRETDGVIRMNALAKLDAKERRVLGLEGDHS